MLEFREVKIAFYPVDGRALYAATLGLDTYYVRQVGLSMWDTFLNGFDLSDHCISGELYLSCYDDAAKFAEDHAKKVLVERAIKVLDLEGYEGLAGELRNYVKNF